MKNENVRIAKMIQELREDSYEGIQKKYAPLFLDVIEENLKFEGELKECILDHNMLEDLLLTKDAHFLTNEFGRSLLGFPEGFVVACMRLYKQFQKHFPYANVIDTTQKNQLYGKNYRSPRHYIWYMEEYAEARKLLRELILKFINALEIKAVPQRLVVIAENVRVHPDKFKLVITIYIGFKNDYPHIFESEFYSTPISEDGLNRIKENIQSLSKIFEWGNEIDYYFGEYIQDYTLEYSPQLTENFDGKDCFLKIVELPRRDLGLRFSHEIDDLPPLRNYYENYVSTNDSIFKNTNKESEIDDLPF